MAMVQFDYDTIKNELVDRLQKKLNGHIIENSTAMSIIEIFAEKFSQVANYAEYLTRESKWSLAQNSSSILTQLELFGYKPHRKKGASGSVRVSADENFSTRYPYNILIPKFTRFSNGNLIYCSTEDVMLSNTSVYVDVPVIQGELKTTGEFLGNSFSGDVYVIENDSIENNLYELTNNNTICTEVDYFGQSQISVNGSSTDTYTYNNFEYKINNLSDFSGIQIEFAPNSHDANDHFEFKYLVTEGETGSSFELYPNGITQVVSSVTDSQGSVVKLYVRQEQTDNYSGAISGGTDVESIDDMRTNAPYTFNRVDKIITKNDYIAAMQSIMSDCIFRIWTEASRKYDDVIFQIDDSNDFINNAKVFFVGVKYDRSRRTIENISSADLYETLLSKLIEKKGITDYFILNEADIFKFYINGKIYYNRNKISDSLIKTQVTDKILESYPVNKAEFKKAIYRSAYTGIFGDVVGIDHVDVNVVLYTPIQFSKDGFDLITNIRYNFGFSLADSSEISISKQFIFTSVDTNADSNTFQLIKDLFMLKYVEADGGWNFYTVGENPIRLSTNTENAPIKWRTNEGQIDEGGVLNSFQIDISTTEGAKIYYGNNDGSQESSGFGLDVNGMVCRFVPENYNCILSSENQIAIYSDSTGDEISGILNPWKGQGKHNWWWPSDGDETVIRNLDKFGIGLKFIAT